MLGLKLNHVSERDHWKHAMVPGQGPTPLTIFLSRFKSHGNLLFYLHSDSDYLFTIKSCFLSIVVAYAKFRRDSLANYEITVKPNFHPIWITVGKSLVK